MWEVGVPDIRGFYPFTDGVIYDTFGSTVRKTVGNPTPSLASWRIYSVYSAAGDWQSYLDSTSLFSTGTNTVSFSATPSFGSNGGELWTGDVAAVVFYDHKLSGTVRGNVWTYLQNKYGL